jgi:hypothetical protein
MEKIAAAITRAVRAENASLMTNACWQDYAVDTDIDPQETPIIWFDVIKRRDNDGSMKAYQNLSLRVAIQIKGSAWRMLINNFQSGSFDHRFMLANSDDKASGITVVDYTKKIASKIVKEFSEHFAA